jgi:hypothetical protein
MADEPTLDEDTSAGRVTQGGRGRARGHSIWWFAIALSLILAGALGLAAAHKHRIAPAERGTTPISWIDLGRGPTTTLKPTAQPGWAGAGRRG